MSLNVIPLDTIKVIPEMFDYKDKKILQILDSGEEVSYKIHNATAITQNSINIKMDPPGKNFVTSPEMLQYLEVELSLTATNTDVVNRSIFEEFGKSGQETAPRSYPLARATQNVEIVVNSTSFSTTLNQYVEGILRYGYCDDDQESKFSLTPTMLDNTYSYALSYNAASRDVMNGDLFQSGKQISRGAFAQFTLVSNPVIAPAATGTAVCLLKISEPLMLSPFYYQKVGLVNVSTMSYTLTIGDFSRMLCRRSTLTPAGNGNPLAITAFSGAVKNFNIQCKYYTPKLLDSIPKNVVYDYNEFFNTGSNASQAIVNAGASTSLTMNSVNLNAVPSRIYIYVAENTADQSFSAGGLSKPDVSNALITSITISWMGRDGLLSSATDVQLYDLSVKNGLKLSWNEWSKYVGSYLCLDVPADLGLKSTQAVGLLSNPQLGMTVNFKNISNRNMYFTLYVKVVYDGIITNMNGAFTKQTGIISQMDSLKSISEVAIVKKDDDKINPVGGVIGGFNPLAILPFIKGAVKGLTQFADVANPIAKKGLEFADSIGLGEYEDEEEVQRIMNKKIVGRKRGGKIGGKMISRSQLYN